MTWPFENDTSDIEKKLAKRSLHRERQRNLFAIIALVLTAFMITATFSIGFSYFETYQMQQIRLMGTTADVGITNVTENQLVDISKSNLATVYKGNIIKNLIMDCQSYTKYRPNETTGGIFVSWRRKEELPTGA